MFAMRVCLEWPRRTLDGVGVEMSVGVVVEIAGGRLWLSHSAIPS